MTSVAIIEDHPVFRSGLEHVVANESTLQLVTSAASLEDFAATDRVRCKVALLDLHLRGGVSGTAAIAELVNHQIYVLVITASTNPNDLVAAVAAGASGYLTKEAGPQEILRAIATVATGAPYISPTLAGALLISATPLSKRECSVLRLLASGDTDAEIARQLHISVSTVRSHLDHIRDKTGARRRAELTRIAYETGVVSKN